MNVPTEQVIAAIVAITGFAGYIVRFFLLLYRDYVIKQTESLTALLQEHRSHDQLSREAHGEQCRVLGEITKNLQSINGKRREVSK